MSTRRSNIQIKLAGIGPQRKAPHTAECYRTFDFSFLNSCTDCICQPICRPRLERRGLANCVLGGGNTTKFGLASIPKKSHIWITTEIQQNKNHGKFFIREKFKRSTHANVESRKWLPLSLSCSIMVKLTMLIIYKQNLHAYSVVENLLAIVTIVEQQHYMAVLHSSHAPQWAQKWQNLISAVHKCAVIR